MKLELLNKENQRKIESQIQELFIIQEHQSKKWGKEHLENIPVTKYILTKSELRVTLGYPVELLYKVFMDLIRWVGMEELMKGYYANIHVAIKGILSFECMGFTIKDDVFVFRIQYDKNPMYWARGQIDGGKKAEYYTKEEMPELEGENEKADFGFVW